MTDTPTPPMMLKQRAATVYTLRYGNLYDIDPDNLADQLEADGVTIATLTAECDAAQAEIARLTAALATAREDAGGLDTQEVHDAVVGALGDAMDCTRVWSAWGYGTMSANDFRNVADDYDRVQEIIAAVKAAIQKGAAT